MSLSLNSKPIKIIKFPDDKISTWYKKIIVKLIKITYLFQYGNYAQDKVLN